MIRRLYLAGPDVFLPDAVSVGRRKVALCAAYGFEGLFPLDGNPPLANAPPRDAGLQIYRANVAQMRSADAIIANLTPFRGPSADVGTAFELGFFAGLHRPILAYSADTASFAERTRSLLGLAAGAERDGDGYSIEPFGLPDNLMLAGAVCDAGGDWVSDADAQEPALAALAAFEKCLRRLAASTHRLAQRSSMMG